MRYFAPFAIFSLLYGTIDSFGSDSLIPREGAAAHFPRSASYHSALNRYPLPFAGDEYARRFVTPHYRAPLLEGEEFLQRIQDTSSRGEIQSFSSRESVELSKGQTLQNLTRHESWTIQDSRSPQRATVETVQEVELGADRDRYTTHFVLEVAKGSPSSSPVSNAQALSDRADEEFASSERLSTYLSETRLSPPLEETAFDARRYSMAHPPRSAHTAQRHVLGQNLYSPPLPIFHKDRPATAVVKGRPNGLGLGRAHSARRVLKPHVVNLSLPHHCLHCIETHPRTERRVQRMKVAQTPRKM